MPVRAVVRHCSWPSGGRPSGLFGLALVCGTASGIGVGLLFILSDAVSIDSLSTLVSIGAGSCASKLPLSSGQLPNHCGSPSIQSSKTVEPTQTRSDLPSGLASSGLAAGTETFAVIVLAACSIQPVVSAFSKSALLWPAFPCHCLDDGRGR